MSKLQFTKLYFYYYFTSTTTTTTTSLCERTMHQSPKHIFKCVCFIGKLTEKSWILMIREMLSISPDNRSTLLFCTFKV